MIKAVIFDLDNTLYQEKKYFYPIYEEIAYLVDQQKPEKILKDMLQYRAIDDSTVFNNIIEKYQLPIMYLSKFIEIYQHSNINLKINTEAKKTLDKLEKYKLGIITNGGYQTQKNKIKLLGLSDEFDEIIITGAYFEKKHWKPHANPFLMMLEKLQLRPEECIYIGDSYKNDVLGSLKVGMKSGYLNIEKEDKYLKQKENMYGNYYEFGSLKSVLKVLEVEEK